MLCSGQHNNRHHNSSGIINVNEKAKKKERERRRDYKSPCNLVEIKDTTRKRTIDNYATMAIN